MLRQSKFLEGGTWKVNGPVVKVLLAGFLVLFLLDDIQLAQAEKFGAVRLCPAGGRSFMMAWNLACEMKKKKRNVGTDGHDATQMTRKRAPDGYRSATLEDIMHICCDFGCDIRDLLSYCDPFGSWNS